jgi:hypothetical protein
MKEYLILKGGFAPLIPLVPRIAQIAQQTSKINFKPKIMTDKDKLISVIKQHNRQAITPSDIDNASFKNKLCNKCASLKMKLNSQISTHDLLKAGHYCNLCETIQRGGYEIKMGFMY